MSYIQDPNDKTKQIPRGLSNPKIFSNATTPAPRTLTKNPSYILLNASGSYSFVYTHTGSLGTVIGTNSGSLVYTSGSVITGDGGLPVRLDINPTAWHMTNRDGKAGEVTFVYRGN